MSAHSVHGHVENIVNGVLSGMGLHFDGSFTLLHLDNLSYNLNLMQILDTYFGLKMEQATPLLVSKMQPCVAPVQNAPNKCLHVSHLVNLESPQFLNKWL